MTGLIATCPVTGNDVFPDFSALRGGPPFVVRCPSCGGMHQWLPFDGALREIGGVEVPDKGSDADGASTPTSK